MVGRKIRPNPACFARRADIQAAFPFFLGLAPAGTLTEQSFSKGLPIMAKSESQGLQIAVIIIAFLTIPLSITTFYCFNELSKTQQTASTYRAEAKKWTTAAKTAQDESFEVKEMIGVPRDTALADLRQTFADDMAKYGGTLAQDKKFYRDALQQQQIDIVTAQKEVAAERVALEGLKSRIDALEGANQSRIAQVQGDFNNKANDFSTTKQGFAEAEQKLVSQKDDLARQIGEKQTQIDEINRAHADTLQEKEKDIATIKQKLDRAGTIVKDLQNPTPDIPDGEVRWVNQRNRTVWINRGSADFLHPLITFSVYASEGNAVARSARKGSIEVTSILGDHLAEAKILEDDINDPLLPGDIIYTPLWDAGKRQRFAFAGVMDIDGNQTDDTEVIQDLVRSANIDVDAWLDSTGKLTGELTILTRYLVVGEAPKNQADAYSKLRSEATRMGIPILPLEKFLEQIGYAQGSRFVDYGRNSDPNQFMDNERDKRFSTAAPNTGNFRPRRPPAAGAGASGKSAY